MRVLVCGGREYADAAKVDATLNAIHYAEGCKIKILIEGGARGADAQGSLWAKRNHVPVARVNAYWELHGKAAGPIRNEAMLVLQPDLVVAFPGGFGTADMVRRARAYGVKVLEVGVDDVSMAAVTELGASLPATDLDQSQTGANHD